MMRAQLKVFSNDQERIIAMKKLRGKPVCTTLMAQELSIHIKAALGLERIFVILEYFVKPRTNNQRAQHEIYRVVLFCVIGRWML